MRKTWARIFFCSPLSAFPLTLALLGLLAACASAPDHPEWIRASATTKDEVVARYGQPDLLIASPDGSTAIYRQAASGPSIPRVEIPIARAAPSGQTMTHMQIIEPGLGAKDLNGEMKERLRNEIRIRYDIRGIVQELSAP